MKCYLISILLLFMFGSSDSDSTSSSSLKVSIELNKTNYKIGENIKVYITLINNSYAEQKILLDRPKTCINGAWYTKVNLTDALVGKSVLKYSCKSIICSNLYTKDELEHHYYILQKGHSLKKEFSLSNLVMYNTKDNKLPKGKYNLNLNYSIADYSIDANSNTIQFSVE